MQNYGRGWGRKGEEHPRARFSKPEVEKLRQDRAKGASLKQLHERTGAPLSTLSDVLRGKSYSDQ